jgi:predicted ABC-type ATPase
VSEDRKRRQRVVILNGPAGVGKSTVGRLLAGRVANGVCIEGDALAGFVVNRSPGSVQQGLGYENGATIAANYIRGGYDLVVFEYCFEERRHVERFLDAYTAPAPVFLFTLWAPLAVVEERERARAGRSRLGERVAACHRAMEQRLDELGDVIEAVAAPMALGELIDRRSLATAGHPGAAGARPL